MDQIAILIPCYNEALTIGKVIDDFARELPESTIYVYDNNSSDDTASIAKQHGAIVRKESRQGKGNVVKQMFREIEAHCYIMVDGDNTYPAESVHKILDPIRDGQADMVIGDRLSNLSYHKENKRKFHNFGNHLVCKLLKWLYGVKVTDAMTGYRGFTYLFVRSFPILAEGFEIEVEMDIHAIDKKWRIIEVPIDYRDRPEGSVSKLSTVRDGFRILLKILSLFKDYKPMVLFGLSSLFLLIVGLGLGISVTIDFVNTGLVERFPTAILAVGLVIMSMLSLVCGFILDTVAKSNRQQYELQVQIVKAGWHNRLGEK